MYGSVSNRAARVRRPAPQACGGTVGPQVRGGAAASAWPQRTGNSRHESTEQDLLVRMSMEHASMEPYSAWHTFYY